MRFFAKQCHILPHCHAHLTIFHPIILGMQVASMESEGDKLSTRQTTFTNPLKYKKEKYYECYRKKQLVPNNDERLPLWRHDAKGPATVFNP
jgi:hypothetical protein